MTFNPNAFSTGFNIGTNGQTTGGHDSFDELLSMYLDSKYQSPVQRTCCPNDGFFLVETERGLFCPFDGWTPGIAPQFIPRNPDNVSS